MGNVLDAELEIITVDGRNFTIAQEDLESLRVEERIQEYKDTGSAVVWSENGDYITGDNQIRAGDEAIFRNQLENESQMTEKWRGLLSPDTFTKKSHNSVQINYSIVDFVFGILSMRKIYSKFEGRQISGGTNPLLQELINRKAPEIKKDKIEPVNVQVDRFCQGTNLLELIIEFASKADALLAQEGRSLVFRLLEDVTPDWTAEGQDFGFPSVVFSDADMANRVRVKGGTASKLEESTEPQQYWYRITEKQRQLYRLSMRKSTIDRIDLWTEIATELEDLTGTDYDFYRSGLKDLTGLTWTESTTTPGEWYVTDAGADPGLTQPNNTYEDREAMVNGTLGTLNAGEWAWGDQDSLGFNTVYVRLSTETDPSTEDPQTVMVDNNVTGASANEWFVADGNMADPGLLDPYNIYENQVSMPGGTLGSLATGEWAYGDNESFGLGFTTIYVRLSDDSDPNTKSRDTVTCDRNGTDPSTASVRIRIQKDEGGSPKDVTDPDSDIANEVIRSDELTDGGLTTFILGDHNLVDPDPWLIIESEGVDGQLIGRNAGVEPVIRSYFQYQLSTVQQNSESIDKHRLREEDYFRENLRTSSEINQIVQAKLDRDAFPDKHLELPANSERAYNLPVGHAITVDFPLLGVQANYILLDKELKFTGPKLDVTLTLQRADTI